MGRHLRCLLMATAILAVGGCEFLTGDFRISGSVDISNAMRAQAPKTNAVLYIVAANAGGVPVAVLRIVNPEFPSSFKMRPEDLLVPALQHGEQLFLHAELNTHGKIGSPKAGDLFGNASTPVKPVASGIKILIDRQK